MRRQRSHISLNDIEGTDLADIIHEAQQAAGELRR
jgi:hypothetical protein